MVAASKSAIALPSRSRRASTSATGRPGEQLHDLVVLVAAGTVEHVDQPVEGADEPLAHAFAQLAGRHPGEGDDQQAVDGQDALGDVAGGQGGDGEGLARAGAGLQQRHAARQLAADVEGLRGRTGCTGRSSVDHLLARQQPVPEPARVDARTAWLSDGSQRGLVARRRTRQRDSISSKVRPLAQDQRVLGVLVLLVEVVAPTPTSPAAASGSPAGRRPRLGPGGRRLGVERQRLAHAAGEEVDAGPASCCSAPSRRDSSASAPSGRDPRRSRSCDSTARLRPMVHASKGRSG